MDLLKPSAPVANSSNRWKSGPGRGPARGVPSRPCKVREAPRPLTEEQRALAEQFLPLARKLAKPLKAMFQHWKDEFESAACMALVEAARSYDPSRNIRFATFARFRIRGALVDVGRAMGLSGWETDRENAPNVVTLTPVNEEHGKVLVAFEPPAVGSEIDDADSVEHWLRKLPKKHAEVCRLYYLYGKTQAEIAEDLQCSQSEVTRLHKKALELLSDPYDALGKANRLTWRRRRASRKRNQALDLQPIEA
ncbi:sigma-70 family RNA polymerase sigma factor [Tundrisphaera lichenicola]|uniref:sigma-70 family RNA polymerase sigma factor n=1 Tax=Tundrisphaera lichenicola TaxID=2029860 RepID=UPI003EBF56C1